MAKTEKRKLAEQVYQLCKQVPQGKVTTYREIAQALGIKGYQAIGQVLRCNPYAPIVPCHRVVKSDGSLGGFKGCVVGKEIIEKQMLLKKEGVEIKENKIDLQQFGFSFS
ncbi:MAG TPA: MGMT family protein [Candidatus Nanoarchaeia archaeon]|nr:MGMT family protein [Candidatus Nanoarchaeia archaeon]